MNIIKNYPLYRKFIASNFISTLGDSMYYIALLTFASQMTNSGLAISMVTLSESIPGIFFILTGSLADMSQNKARKTIINGIIRGILYLLVGVLIGFQSSLLLLAGICLLNFISDIIGKYSSGLMTPFVLFMVKTEDIEEAQGLNGAITNLVSLLAQFVGAYLMGLFSYQVLAWINSGAFFITVVILFFMKASLDQIEKEKLVKDSGNKISLKRMVQQILSSLKEIKECQPVFRAIMMFAIANGGLVVLVPLISMLFSQQPQLVIQNFPFTLALSQGMISAGVILGSLFGPKALQSTSLFTICQGMFLVIGVIGIAMYGQLIWLLLGSLLVVGLLIGSASPKLNVLIISSFDVTKLGTINGGINTLLLIVPPVATVIFTTTATSLNLKAAILLLLVFAVLSFTIGQLTTPKVKPQRIKSTS
ncbi:MFS transporter [uncultured Vagococcus sp.]|uniref:MFS transporter n=1 Tax=uncultured Vagococcus sp. TaxID=189676 RepID=UPI0028D29623|nr:MFS transporter [uncultured Vagococcus sp.]